MNLLNAFRKEWMESIRSYKFLIVAVVLVLFGLTSPLVAKVLPQVMTSALPQGAEISKLIPPPTVWDAVAQYQKNMAQFGLILAVLVTMGTVTQEKDKGTAAMMLVKPLPRGSFIGAKFLALAAIFAVSIIIAGTGAFYYTLLLFESLNITYWLVLNVFLFVYVMVIVALTLLCSTLTRSQGAAAGISMGIIVVGLIIGVIRNTGKYLPGELNTWGARLLHGDTTASWPALGISIGLVVLFLMAAWLIFRRQEL